MAIRFACAKCGKIHRVPDRYAGKRGRCGRCGLRFVAPGAVPAPSNIFVAADADDDPFHVRLTTRAARPGDRSRGPILVGLLAGCLMVSLLFLFRDGIVSNAPALAPLMPPKVDPTPVRAPAAQPNAGITFEPEFAAGIAGFLLALAHLLLCFVFPLMLPAVLSRLRVLSVGRWLIMTGLCAFFAATGIFLFWAALGLDAVNGGRQAVGVAQASVMLATIGIYLFVPSFFGIPGCLLAAAIHPKAPSKP